MDALRANLHYLVSWPLALAALDNPARGSISRKASAGKGAIAGDIVSPAISDEDWVNSSDLGGHACCRLAGV